MRNWLEHHLDMNNTTHVRLYTTSVELASLYTDEWSQGMVQGADCAGLNQTNLRAICESAKHRSRLRLDMSEANSVLLTNFLKES